MSALSERLKQRKIELDESIDRIAERARRSGHPIDRTTVDKYLRDVGAKRPPERTIRGLAAGFGIPAAEIRLLLSMPAGNDGMWTPTEEASKLTRDQRRALDQLIKTMVRVERGVTELEPTRVQPVADNEVSRQVAEPQEVSETGASPTEAAGMGPRKKTPEKKDADAPPTPRTRKPDNPIRPAR